jgi:hypothetical protein
MDTHGIARRLLEGRADSIDRRSLSQAWYSALHGAEPSRSRAPGRKRPCEAPAPARRAPHPRTAATAAGAANARRAAAATSARGVPTPLASARSAAALLRAALRVPKPAERAACGTALTLLIGEARVHVHVRRAGATVTIVALCGGNRTAAVARALAGVEHELRRQGESVRSHVVTIGAPG